MKTVVRVHLELKLMKVRRVAKSGGWSGEVESE